jgi:sarcosine dehydrogenase
VAAGKPLRKRLCGFTTEDSDVVLSGRETILRDGEFVGYLTSGGYGYTVGSPIGLGYVRNLQGVSDDWLNSGRYALVVANDVVPAALHQQPLYDPAGLRVRDAPGSNSRST